MTKPVINIEQLEYHRFGQGDKFQADRAPVGALIGAEKLGYAVIRLQPGKCAWPYHSHHAIEEMFYVLSGTGTLRHAGDEYPIRAGDFICSPADPEKPHQIVNTSDQELSYVAISANRDTDVMFYPDSGKFGAWHGDASQPGGPGNFSIFAPTSSAVGYWVGEVDDPSEND